ncbi:MAG: hypothetical protein WD689_09745 [Gaiellaceae bacterium]
MWDTFRGKSDKTGSFVAAEDAQQLATEAPALVDAAQGASWYAHPGNEVDAAVAALCRLRRAASGERARMEAGDDAVRAALERADPEAVLWLTARVISYMDEQGFPDDVEPWLNLG